jgi:hypothetical protein
MNKILILIVLTFVVFSCKDIIKESPKTAINYISFGKKITADKHLSKEEISSKFKNLKKGDTIQVKFASKINKVCKKKGCWMRLDLNDKNETLVRFKDYGFFMPLNSDNKEVIVRGKAYLDVVTVTQLQHYAKDEGLSEEEINKITKDEVTYAVESDGVLMVE